MTATAAITQPVTGAFLTLPSFDQMDEVNKLNADTYSCIESITGRLREIIAAYDERSRTDGLEVPTLAYIGGLYAFSSDLTYNAGQLTNACRLLKEQLDVIDGLRRDVAIRNDRSGRRSDSVFAGEAAA